MCEICHAYRCPSGCPGAERDVVGICGCCGEVIAVGEAYVRTGDGELFHVDCLEGLALDELIELLGLDAEVWR